MIMTKHEKRIDGERENVNVEKDLSVYDFLMTWKVKQSKKINKYQFWE